MRFALSAIPMSLAPDHDEWMMRTETRMARLADELGYDIVMVGERHFSGAVGGNPLLSLAALAPVVKNAWFGTGVAVVPNYHPVRLAEMLNIVDHLTRGKAIFGLGSGMSPEDAVAFGFEISKQTDAMFYDGIDALLELWDKQGQDDPVLIDGEHYKGALLERITPTPYRKARPHLKITAHSPTNIDLAARNGWPVFFIKRDPEDAKALFDAYKIALASHNHPPEVVAHCREWTSISKPSMHIAETDEQAAEEWAYLDEQIKPFAARKLAYAEQARQRQGHAAPLPNVEKRHTQEFRSHMSVYSGVEPMIDHVRSMQDAGYGLFHLSFIPPVDERGLEIWERSARLFAERVMPHFRGDAAARPADAVPQEMTT